MALFLEVDEVPFSPRAYEKEELAVDGFDRPVAEIDHPAGRRHLGRVLPLARDVERRLSRLPGVKRAAVAGSVRRRRETIGDLDFRVSARDPENVGRAFTRMPEVVHVYGRAETKGLVRLADGMDADPLAEGGGARRRSPTAGRERRRDERRHRLEERA